MHHSTMFSLPVLILAVLLACSQVSPTLPSISEAGSITKSIGGATDLLGSDDSSSAAASSAAASSLGAGGSSSASSAAASSSAKGSSSASSAAASSAGAKGGSSASSAASSSASANGGSSSAETESSANADGGLLPLGMLSKAGSFSKAIGDSSPISSLSKSASFTKAIGVPSVLPHLAKVGSFSKSIGESSHLGALSKAASYAKSVGSASIDKLSKATKVSKSVEEPSPLPDLTKSVSFSKSFGFRSPLKVLSKAGSISKSFSITSPKLPHLPPPVHPKPVPKPVPNPIPKPLPDPIPLPPCTPNPGYVVIPQYIPASGSFFEKVPEVTLCINAFLNYIYSNDMAQELFDLSEVSIDLYADVLKSFLEESLNDIGVENASSLAQFVYQSIMRNFGCSGCPQLSLAVLIRKYANTMAHIMYIENLLTLDNAESLGLAYGQTMAESASVSMTSDPASKPQALSSGFSNFLQYIGLYKKEKADIIVLYTGTEYYKAASDYRWW